MFCPSENVKRFFFSCLFWSEEDHSRKKNIHITKYSLLKKMECVGQITFLIVLIDRCSLDSKDKCSVHYPMTVNRVIYSNRQAFSLPLPSGVRVVLMLLVYN